jgi:hypothetical protein
MLGLMRVTMHILAGLAVAAICGAPAAAPAPWFKWRSKLDGKQFCAQTSLGPGWEKAGGPYQDSHCEKLLAAK